MTEPWTPALSIREVAGRCRLNLGGHVHGEGATLQEAADDLVRRLLALAMSLREAGFRISPEVPGSSSSTSLARSPRAETTSARRFSIRPPSYSLAINATASFSRSTKCAPETS